MATLADVALDCAIQIGRANAAGTAILDLENQIKKQIREAIRFYNRKPWNFTEVRDITLTTVADQRWYSTVNLTGASGDQTLGAEIDVNDILSIDYMREASLLTSRMYEMSYEDFERFNEGSSLGGIPSGYTLYAGQIGIYPIPTETYTITFSAHVKPVVPQADADESIWFDEAQELIEAAALKRVALKYLRDPQRASEFAAMEAQTENHLHAEHIRKTSTGRIKAHC